MHMDSQAAFPTRSVYSSVGEMYSAIAGGFEATPASELFIDVRSHVPGDWGVRSPATVFPFTNRAQRYRDLRPQSPPDILDAIRTLSQRRLELFADDGRAVDEWSLVMEADQWQLRCDARVPSHP